MKIEKFQHPDARYFAICLSNQVGGVGLTLTAADRVILVDPAWNPAMDAQAIDRVHRIGQTKEVVVYRLIGAAAIEDKMFRLQVFKQGIAKTALEHEHQMRYFTHKEIKSLFEHPDVAVSTQTLMAEKVGTEALEHEDLLRTVAGDVGGVDDPKATAFWQSTDLLGFSDYQRLFARLEESERTDKDADNQRKAQKIAATLLEEEYVADQVVSGKLKKPRDDGGLAEALPQGGLLPPAESMDVEGQPGVGDGKDGNDPMPPGRLTCSPGNVGGD